MCDYFADYIFRKLNCSKDEEINLQKVKDMILKGGEEGEIFELFCGFSK